MMFKELLQTGLDPVMQIKVELKPSSATPDIFSSWEQ
jgi:hypothetical protein